MLTNLPTQESCLGGAQYEFSELLPLLLAFGTRRTGFACAHVYPLSPNVGMAFASGVATFQQMRPTD